MIRIDSLWLAVEPVDMRAGAERLLARVVQVFGCAQAHHGYLFANARATRIKLLAHDGFGVWCAARRLNEGRFVWPREALAGAAPVTLTQLPGVNYLELRIDSSDLVPLMPRCLM